MSEMKLSEAMRLGAMMKPQGFGALEQDGSTCAVGAACDALGILERECHTQGWGSLIQVFPIIAVLVGRKYKCPVRGCRGRYGHGICVLPHLNDVHRWTREQIADWVESIERAHDPVIATEDHSALEPAVELGALAQK